MEMEPQHATRIGEACENCSSPNRTGSNHNHETTHLRSNPLLCAFPCSSLILLYPHHQIRDTQASLVTHTQASNGAAQAQVNKKNTLFTSPRPRLPHALPTPHLLVQVSCIGQLVVKRTETGDSE